MSRSKRRGIAEETINIIQTGQYQKDNQIISIKEEAEQSIKQSELFPMNHWNRGKWNALEFILKEQSFNTKINVLNQTSLAASHQLVESDGGGAKVLCLNFASAKNPGGGFLGGSQAQEESLARSSSLYPTLTKFMPEMYEFHRRRKSCLYTHTMIYSPAVPVFRDDSDELLSEPYLLSFLTSPAVNAGAVNRNEPQNTAKIEATMLERIERVLAISFEKGYKKLVLGAWGCGVFQNKPIEMANWFAQFLLKNGKYAQAFEDITFAVLDHSKDGKFISAFEDTFG